MSLNTIPLDKQKHLLGGFIISTVVALALPDVLYGLEDHLWALGVVAMIATVKEGRDALGYGTPEFMDWVYTLGGAIPALCFL